MRIRQSYRECIKPCKSNRSYGDPDEKTALVVVPDYQLSLAIGKEGQNARLAARLTGFKIDIKSETRQKNPVISMIMMMTRLQKMQRGDQQKTSEDS